MYCPDCADHLSENLTRSRGSSSEKKKKKTTKKKKKNSERKNSSVVSGQKKKKKTATKRSKRGGRHGQKWSQKRMSWIGMTSAWMEKAFVGRETPLQESSHDCSGMTGLGRGSLSSERSSFEEYPRAARGDSLYLRTR